MTKKTPFGLRKVPKSIVGDAVGHHPDRKIYRVVPAFFNEDWPTSRYHLSKADSLTGIEATDYWKR